MSQPVPSSRRRRRLLKAGAVAALGAVALLKPASTLAAPGAGVTSGIATNSISCSSPSLGGQLPAMVYLPADYDPRSRRHRVIYFLQGLPAGPSAYRGYGYIADAVSAAGRDAIVVVPQAARAPGSDREYLDWSPSEDWPKAISHDLTRCIDSRYHTIAHRRGRALIGVSAGGYGAFNIGLRHLQTFGAVESWSGYFAATDPSGKHMLNLGSAKANRAARVPRGSYLSHEASNWPSLIAFYVGQSDSEFFNKNQRFDRSLTAKRISHFYRTYAGGHSHSLWAQEAPSWLSLALDSLSKGAG